MSVSVKQIKRPQPRHGEVASNLMLMLGSRNIRQDESNTQTTCLHNPSQAPASAVRSTVEIASVDLSLNFIKVGYRFMADLDPSEQPKRKPRGWSTSDSIRNGSGWFHECCTGTHCKPLSFNGVYDLAMDRGIRW